MVLDMRSNSIFCVVIRCYQQRLYFVSHQLAKSLRRKRKYLLTIPRQSRGRAYTDLAVARYELLIRKVQAKAKCISTKIKLFISLSRPTNIGMKSNNFSIIKVTKSFANLTM
ncbi:hypothetical protein LINGRAHAP2_LOCUS15657 [Linum grandiflorum]